MLLARFLMIFATPETAAVFANSLSALSSSFTILFLFWSITHLAKKMTVDPAGEVTSAERWAVMGAGAVGALAPLTAFTLAMLLSKFLAPRWIILGTSFGTFKMLHDV